MDTKARPKTQLTPTGNPPIEHLQLTITEDIKNTCTQIIKNPPLKFRTIFAEVLESLTKKNPKVMNGNYPEVGAGLRRSRKG